MTNQEKQKSNYQAGFDLPPGWTLAFYKRPHQQNRARDEVPEASGVERRNRGDRVANGEISRAPDDIDGEECDNDTQTICRCLGYGDRGSFYRFERCGL